MKQVRRGFTLVELLVVIGIIALLISVLLPALSKARSQAVTLSCLSQIRQLSTACVMYYGENKGYLPPITVSTASNGTYGRPTVFPAKAGQESFLGKYLGAKVNFSIFTCPELMGEPNYDPVQSTSYRYHRWIGGENRGAIVGTTRYLQPYKITDIRQSSMMALIVDGTLVVGQSPGQVQLGFYDDPKSESLGTGNNYHSGTTTNMIIHQRKQLDGTFVGFKNGVTQRARGKNNVGFCDGSVRTVNVDCTTYTPAFPAWEDVRFNIQNSGSLKW